MRYITIALVLSLIFTISYSVDINNSAGISITQKQIDDLARDFGVRENVKVERIDIYFENSLLRYKVHSYTDFKLGMSIIRNPRTYVLDEDWNIITQTKTDNIGAKAAMMGLPGIIIYSIYSFIGWI